MSSRVMIVDDSVYMRSLIRMALEESGFEVVGEASDGRSTLELVEDLQPDIITLDNILNDMVGLDIIDALKEKGNEPKILMVTAMGQTLNRNEALNQGVHEYIVKPFPIEELVEKVKALSV